MVRRWHAILFVVPWLGGCTQCSCTTPGRYTPSPTSEITSPLEGDQFAERSVFSAAGTVSDPNFEPADLATTWSDGGYLIESTPPDEFGNTTATFTTPNYGNARLVLIVVTPDGLTARHEIELVIFDVLDQPSISIGWPAANQRIIAGEPVALEATVTNDNPADTELTVRIESDVNGLLCEDYATSAGEFECAASFSTGPHTVTFTVTNSEGGEASASVGIEATPAD